MDEQVRCFCRNKPLLAVCGRDARSSEPFVHVKTWKGGRLYAEVIITSGVARIRCRDCLRWHTIRIVKLAIDVRPEELPVTIKV